MTYLAVKPKVSSVNLGILQKHAPSFSKPCIHHLSLINHRYMVSLPIHLVSYVYIPTALDKPHTMQSWHICQEKSVDPLWSYMYNYFPRCWLRIDNCDERPFEEWSSISRIICTLLTYYIPLERSECSLSYHIFENIIRQ